MCFYSSFSLVLGNTSYQLYFFYTWGYLLLMNMSPIPTNGYLTEELESLLKEIKLLKEKMKDMQLHLSVRYNFRVYICVFAYIFIIIIVVYYYYFFSCNTCQVFGCPKGFLTLKILYFTLAIFSKLYVLILFEYMKSNIGISKY